MIKKRLKQLNLNKIRQGWVMGKDFLFSLISRQIVHPSSFFLCKE